MHRVLAFKNLALSRIPDSIDMPAPKGQTPTWQRPISVASNRTLSYPLELSIGNAKAGWSARPKCLCGKLSIRVMVPVTFVFRDYV